VHLPKPRTHAKPKPTARRPAARAVQATPPPRRARHRPRAEGPSSVTCGGCGKTSAPFSVFCEGCGEPVGGHATPKTTAAPATTWGESVCGNYGTSLAVAACAMRGDRR
jgi:hypothetical protein